MSKPHVFTFHMDDKTNRLLRQLSERTGVPMAEIIRRALALYCAQPYSEQQLKYGQQDSQEPL